MWLLNYYACTLHGGAPKHSFVSWDCKSASGLHGPINLAPKHSRHSSNGRCPRVRIYTHPTCLIRRQQWHNKSWRLQSRLPGRVRQTDRPSNAFIIILNHIFSSLSLPRAFIPRSKHRRFRPPCSPPPPPSPPPLPPFNSTRFPLSFSLPLPFSTSCGRASNTSIP